jgi:CheY-like chemotaxis protein
VLSGLPRPGTVEKPIGTGRSASWHPGRDRQPGSLPHDSRALYLVTVVRFPSVSPPVQHLEDVRGGEAPHLRPVGALRGNVSRGRILVIENEDAIRTLLGLVLEAEDYVVRTAANGAEGLSVLTSWQPDVIVLDLMMPVMSGQEFLDRRAADPRLGAIPVVVVSAATAALPTADRAHVDGIVTKPHDIDALLQVLERARRRRAGSSGHHPS